MNNTWQVQEAKARFSAFLETALRHGPQIVTKRGVETAVLIPVDYWHRLETMAKPTLKDLLLAPEARTDTLVPPRREIRQRPAPDFE
jgi:prevent-host-death family protein